jgi:serine/threonine protein kinase
MPPTIDHADPYVVVKEVPTFDRVMDRLRVKFTDVPYSVIEKRALKFTNKVFPLFLTREAAMLKILHRDLPREYRCRVPSLLHMEKDEKGYAKRIWMNWLRIGGQPLSQLEFARQSADLLRVVHDHAQIIHLDLRLDNFLITENGVCFVDFGSAVRMGENIGGNPLLSTIFEELMRTSQIQRMLFKMSSEGTVTSKVMSDAVGKVDKQVDLFYLAVQINQPLHNPDFASLVKYDPKSREADALAELTRDILKPPDPANPKYKSAVEMLAGIKRVEVRLKKG